MQKGNRNHFELLKQKIVVTMQQSYPGISPVISEWKGQEITDFQEELLAKVNEHISEKWFYNHIKTENQSLPRIDVLNLLSRYVGYVNWNDFVFQNSDPVKPGRSISGANRLFIMVPLLVICIVAILFFFYKLISNREYRFDFYDAYTREVIKGDQTEIRLISDDESPKIYLSDTAGSIIIRTNERVLKMVVSTPYYKPDTITRILNTFERDQKISLLPNDYALVIHYFSEMKVDDWQKRRDYLDRVIAEEAMIYQVMNGRNAPVMELLGKDEFIDRLTMPVQSLKNIEILDMKIHHDQIVVIRFRINENL